MTRSAIIGLTLFAAIAVPTAPALATQFLVNTYHYDKLRTGWNRFETKLTPANVGPTSFGVLAQVVLDDQVDAQPLVVPNQRITAGPTPGTYQVVYVATEANTIYAINAATGAVLHSRHLGTPVPTPLGCGNNGPNVGITSTPVIDVVGQTLYVVAYELISGIPTYQIFALNLKDLTNQTAPRTVAASHTLSDGTTIYHFNAAVQRQRAALLAASGNVYAAFASFCDFSANQSRGWLLGWHGGTLAPLAANRLTDTLATGSYFLSAIWMSGYGVAAAPSGNLFFSTGNSAPGTYDGVRNIQQSVVKVGPQLVNLLSIFTPAIQNLLDQADSDLSSGGVLLLPAQPGRFPFLAVTAGKEGTMYLLNRASLGGFTPGGPDHVLDTKTIGGCWCGPSYFTGPDGIGRVVSSGRSGGEGSNLAQITVWKVKTSPTAAFVQEGAASPIASGQDGGTFTTVSSNGTQAGTAIIWATGRPTDADPAALNLYAFAATPSSGTLPLLFSSQAGSWPNVGGDANIVPVVANGRVFVASNKQLTIFGLGGHPFVALAAAAGRPTALTPLTALNSHMPPHAITGVLEHAEGPVLTLRTRTGTIARVDDSEALRKEQTAVLVPGNAYTAQGTTYDSAGVLHAQVVTRAKASTAIWPRDR
jgi:outer membrane protein assembly factor BamB